MKSKTNNSKTFSLLIVGNNHGTIAWCSKCRKKLVNYRMIRYHFTVNCILEEAKFSKISKIGRILGDNK